MKQYLVIEGLGDVPVLANIYVPTASIARKMQSGEIPGCVVPDEFIRRLEKEKKPEIHWTYILALWHPEEKKMSGSKRFRVRDGLVIFEFMARRMLHLTAIGN